MFTILVRKQALGLRGPPFSAAAREAPKGCLWPKACFWFGLGFFVVCVCVLSLHVSGLVWVFLYVCVCVCVRAIGHSVISDFTTPRIVAHQALLPMGFPRQEYWSGLPFPTPGNLPGPGIKPFRLLHLWHCKRVLYC